MNYFISEEEYAEISAKIDLSLEDISCSSQEEAENQELPEISSDPPEPVSASILNFESWKKYLEVRESVEKEQILQQNEFTEALKDLRKVTHDKEVNLTTELQKIEEIPDEEVKSEETFEKQEEIKETSEKITKIIEKGKEKDLETEKEKNESLVMAEEDFLSKLFENWTKKEAKLLEDQKKKEIFRQQEKIEEKKKRKIRIAEVEEKRIKHRIELKEKQEKDQAEKARKIQEEAQRSGEENLMKVEDQWSHAFRKYLKDEKDAENLKREHKTMKVNDDLSLAFRNQVPYIKRKMKYFTEFSPFQTTRDLNRFSFPSSIVFPFVASNTSLPSSPKLKSIPLPTCPKVLRIPELKEEKVSEFPTLESVLPYPLDSHSTRLEVKHEDLKSISGLNFFKNLESLALSLNKIEKVQNLPGTLKHLDLSQNLIASLPELPCPLLEELILEMNQLQKIQGLKNCQNLRTLSMNHNKLTQVEGLEKCYLLSKLLLYRNEIKEISKTCFTSNPYLIHIDLGKNKLEKVDFLEKLSLLKTLILYKNSIKSIQNLSQPLLQELWLNDNCLTSLSFIQSCPQLENLRLEDNSISSITAFECPLLQNFTISFNDLQNFSEIVKCIQFNRNLKNFSFNDNPIILIHPELLPMFNEIVVKALPFIQELNNTPRTSLVKTGLSNAESCLKAFDLHQIDVLEQKIRRKNEILRFVDWKMKEFLLEIPARVFNFYVVPNEISLNIRGVEWFWYQARKALFRETMAVRVIQSWWKFKLFKRKRLLIKFGPLVGLVVRIQKNFRGWRVRKDRVRGKGLEKVKKIIRIQAAFRGFRLRKMMKSALSKVRTDDLDIKEFQEVNLDDVDLNYDFNNELIIPKNLDLSKFFIPVAPTNISEESKTPKLPPLKPGLPKPGPISNINAGRPSSNRSLQSSTQSSLPPIIKNKAKEDLERHLDEWGFSNPEVKEALQYRIMKKMQRKNKNKKTTADERLEKFRKSLKK